MRMSGAIEGIEIGYDGCSARQKVECEGWGD